MYSYYTGCHRRNGPNFGRVFLMLKYTDITQNTYIQSWTVTEIMAREVWNYDSCYTLTDLPNSYWNWQEYVVSVMLISVLNIKVTCEWYKAIKLNYKNTRLSLGLPSTVHIGSNEMLSYRVGRSLCHHSLTVNALHSCRCTLRGNARCPHFSLAIISVTVQLWI